MSGRSVGVVAALLCWSGTLAAGEKVDIPYEMFKLDNGLTVIVHEDHSVPVVHTEVWYKVGSQNEKPGLTGFAHLFEHLMFQGSLNHDTEYFAPLQAVGGIANGSTNPDRTNYFERLPSNYLDLAMWLEADRMGWLLPSLTQEKLDNQRDVVKNERRQRYENVPYGMARLSLYETLYPMGHPYHFSTIGTPEDLDAASLEEVKAFFATWYLPNNASLVVAGDVTVAEVKASADRWFGGIPAGPAGERVKPAEVKLDGVKRVTLEDKVSLPRVYMAWHSVPVFAKGDADLDILAQVLGGGLSSRLTKALVYDQRIAQDVTVYQYGMELAGTFQIIADVAPGHTAEEVEKALDAELARLATNPPTEEEITRARNAYEASFVKQLESIGGKAGRLAFNYWIAGDPGYIQKELDTYYQVTPATVAEAAKKYLDPNARVILTVNPRPTK